MKKILSLTMAAAMALSLAACGNTAEAPAEESATTNSATSEAAEGGETSAAIAVSPRSATSAPSTTRASTRAAGKLSKPTAKPTASTSITTCRRTTPLMRDRQSMIRKAVSDGYDTVVCVGYLYGSSIDWAAAEYPDVNFIGVDITAGDINAEGNIPSNVYCITFKEEQAGYLAGYAAVKDGFTNLGFLGGRLCPPSSVTATALCRALTRRLPSWAPTSAINYWYGNQFFGDANITAKMESWYQGGTEVVFACGGGIYTSAVEAAVKYDGKVIGVDVDQHYVGEQGVADGAYSYNPFLTSAMKGLGRGRDRRH